MTKHLLGCLLASITLVAIAAARGQDGYAAWSQIENAKETREYKEKLRDGGPCDGVAKAYLGQIALPQLSLESNRRTIDRVRRRMREVLLTDIADEKAFEEASRVIQEFMVALARDEQAEPVVRVNAMLLVGDMKTRDGKPWPPASATLAAAVRDDKLPQAVRVAAVGGLARHAEALGNASAEAVAAFAKEAGPAVQSIVAAAARMPQPATPRGAEELWMASRALAMLPVVAPAATKDVAAALTAIMGDAGWPIDVRVRAAAALGQTVTAESGVDAAAATAAIRGLARFALEADVAAATRRRAEQAYRMQDNDGPGPANQQASGEIPRQVARRDAWRLAVLADAVLTADEKRGLAKLAGKDAEAAAALAATLRENGITIDASPTEKSLLAAIEGLQGRAEETQPKPSEPAVQPGPQPGGEESPFDQSPFGK